MSTNIKSKLTDSEIGLLGAIKESDATNEEKISQLFSELNDPILSAEEVQEWLGLDQDVVENTLKSLIDQKELESSDTTIRPLDDEEVKLYRKFDRQFSRLKIVAIEADLGNDQRRLQFICDGRLIRSIAKIDRLNAISGEGNQREEVASHVKKIATGITEGTQVPNSVLLVLDATKITEEDEGPESFVKINTIQDWIDLPIPNEEGKVAQRFRVVELDIPYRAAAFDDEKIALLVDGQQRTSALSLVDIEKIPQFFFSVNAVIADPVEAKRVFQVANSTVKISVQFSRALDASMGSTGYLNKEKIRAQAVLILSLQDSSSPFYNLVQYPGHKQTPRPPIVYNSMFQIVSTFAESALPLEDDAKKLSDIVKKAYDIVKSKWPTAWGKRPSESKLMHGAGLKAIGELLATKMVTLYSGFKNLEDPALWNALEKSLDNLRNIIIWCNDDFPSANKTQQNNFKDHINGVQNTPKDTDALSKWLQKESLSLDIKK